MPDTPQGDAAQGGADRVNPRDFLKALLRIKPEDAEKAREDSPATRRRKPPEGPAHDFGEE